MKVFALLMILASLAFCFQVAEPAKQVQVADPTKSVPVSKPENLKWSCQSCANTCGYGGFPYYCADAYYCVCTYQTSCPVSNIC